MSKIGKDAKCIWIVLILLVAGYEIHSWYGKTYCANTATPTLCSKD